MPRTPSEWYIHTVYSCSTLRKPGCLFTCLEFIDDAQPLNVKPRRVPKSFKERLETFTAPLIIGLYIKERASSLFRSES